MLFAAACMDLEGIKLNERSQKEKDKYNITSMWYLKKYKLVNIMRKEIDTDI